jgi:hypothetical protein
VTEHARVLRLHPAQVFAIGGNQLSIGGLGDRCDRAAMVGEIFHLGGSRAGVGGHRDRAELDTGKPGEHRLDAIVEMDQHEIARLDAAFDQPRSERTDPLMKFAVAPFVRRRVERRPDQKRMVAPRLAAHL